MNIEHLEQRLCATADADVFGPPIPDHINYVPRPVLTRTVPALELPAVLPEPTETGVSVGGGGLALRDTVAANLFASYAEDGVVDLEEARDWLVSMDDDTGYNRFEVGEAKYQVNNSDNIELFTPKAFYLLTSVVNGNEQNSQVSDINNVHYNDSEFIDVQPLADAWYFTLNRK